MEKKEYYVYCYYDDNNLPFYIGMGKGIRMDSHLQKSRMSGRNTFFYNKLKKLIKEDRAFSYGKIKEELTIQEAKIIEMFLIKAIGRRDLEEGPLCNLTDGGEGHMGYRKSEELKQRISEWSKGKKMSEEQRKILVEINTGKVLSDETRRKISLAQKGISKPKSIHSLPNYREGAKKRVSNEEYAKKFKDVMKKKYSIKVIQLTMCGDLIKIWNSHLDAADYINGRADRITDVCKGVRTSHKRYKWEYYDK